MGHTAQVHSDASQLLLIDHHKLDHHADHENDDGDLQEAECDDKEMKIARKPKLNLV